MQGIHISEPISCGTDTRLSLTFSNVLYWTCRFWDLGYDTLGQCRPMTYCQTLAVKNLFYFRHLVPELIELKGFCVWICPDVDPSSMGPRQGTPVFSLEMIKRLILCGRILPQESDFATLNILPTPLGLFFYSIFTENLTVCLVI